MDERRSLGPAVVAVMLATALLAGCLGEEEKTDPDPVVKLEGPSEAWVGDIVEFNTSGTKDDDTELDALDFEWDMGDNTTYKGKPFVSKWIMAVNHTYELEGTYRVDLTVTDVWGNEGNANWSLFVRYQLNMTVNSRGTWLSEDSLNNTTYFNITIRNVWTGQFDVPPLLLRLANATGGEVVPRALTGDPVPGNLTAGSSFTFQAHFRPPEGFGTAVSLRVSEKLVLDLAGV